ncbi:uncharacterized protein LOC142080928 [Calonectris borealis]|uniref:uncharacterized protein LOC142080928 n=1 Tax=Calonectris borealis TaxID=1323832 RepID=UPI003F4B28E4
MALPTPLLLLPLSGAAAGASPAGSEGDWDEVRPALPAEAPGSPAPSTAAAGEARAFFRGGGEAPPVSESEEEEAEARVSSPRAAVEYMVFPSPYLKKQVNRQTLHTCFGQEIKVHQLWHHFSYLRLHKVSNSYCNKEQKTPAITQHKNTSACLKKGVVPELYCPEMQEEETRVMAQQYCTVLKTDHSSFQDTQARQKFLL